MSRIIEKIGFNLKKKAFQVLKPQIVATAKFSIDGKVVREVFCESLTFNFLQCFYARGNANSNDFANSVFNSSYENNKTRQVDGSYFSYPSQHYRWAAGLGVDNMGIVLGTGSTAVAAADYAMETQIVDGTGSGQLGYQPQLGVQAPEVTGLVTDMIFQRSFVNNSGGTISVTELGVYGWYSSLEVVMLLHDIVTSIPVLNTKTLVVEIKFSITT